MKFYSYDHCPFCNRVVLAAALKGIGLGEIIELPYADKATPEGISGQKLLPIWIDDKAQIHTESLEIIQLFNTLRPEPGFSKLQSWVEPWIQSSRQAIFSLALPRLAALDPKALGTPEDLAYFTHKFESALGPFEVLQAKADELVQSLAPAIDKLNSHFQGPYFQGENPGYDDIHLWPFLRLLDAAKDFPFPAPIREYIDRLCQMTALASYSNN